MLLYFLINMSSELSSLQIVRISKESEPEPPALEAGAHSQLSLT
jgi:hypothetical protein